MSSPGHDQRLREQAAARRERDAGVIDPPEVREMVLNAKLPWPVGAAMHPDVHARRERYRETGDPFDLEETLDLRVREILLGYTNHEAQGGPA